MQTRLVTVRGDTQSVRSVLDKLVATLDTVSVTVPENARSPTRRRPRFRPSTSTASR